VPTLALDRSLADPRPTATIANGVGSPNRHRCMTLPLHERDADQCEATKMVPLAISFMGTEVNEAVFPDAQLDPNIRAV